MQNAVHKRVRGKKGGSKTDLVEHKTSPKDGENPEVDPLQMLVDVGRKPDATVDPSDTSSFLRCSGTVFTSLQ